MTIVERTVRRRTDMVEARLSEYDPTAYSVLLGGFQSMRSRLQPKEWKGGKLSSYPQILASEGILLGYPLASHGNECVFVRDNPESGLRAVRAGINTGRIALGQAITTGEQEHYNAANEPVMLLEAQAENDPEAGGPQVFVGINQDTASRVYVYSADYLPQGLLRFDPSVY